MKLTQILVAASLPLFLAACSDSDSNSYSSVDFWVSDAPVEGLSAVVIAFDRLEFIHSDGERTFHDIAGYEQINLLEYPDTQSALIISDIALRTGEYKNLIIHIEPDQDLNYVIKTDALGVQEDLKQPSNKLKLGSFTVTDEAVQAFTIEFDLRQSLVLRGNNNNNNGYNLKPHGVTIIDNDGAASLSGSVDEMLLEAGGCDVDTGNFVYLYQGKNLVISALADNFDPLDSEFDDGALSASGFIAPYASTGLDVVNDFAFGFLPAGDYTLAFSCSAVADDPIQFDGLTIPDPVGQLVEISLSAGDSGSHTFNL
ncbi:MAG: DUF4382 domain-containing protein [Moritella sp.]|uniref:DUF4382 domain-containing protein n=1 Tax=Moritella sp. TaxID=78556 RepID=UPI0021749C89|nr:DUF4382 domain-containing protein [Moritella sp.]MBL1415769.1 DUF4382 domain-containing protein [Moritella sp.]